MQDLRVSVPFSLGSVIFVLLGLSALMFAVGTVIFTILILIVADSSLIQEQMY